MKKNAKHKQWKTKTKREQQQPNPNITNPQQYQPHQPHQPHQPQHHQHLQPQHHQPQHHHLHQPHRHDYQQQHQQQFQQQLQQHQQHQQQFEEDGHERYGEQGGHLLEQYGREENGQQDRGGEVQQLDNEILDECNVFVKYLPPELTDAEFYQLFKGFGAILSHKIMIDQRTGKSLGYGFVRYGHSSASQNAIKAMNGVRVSNKRLLCKLANISPSSFSQEAPKNPVLHSEDPSDNLYIKPLLKETTEEDLFNLFIPFGPISECKVMLDRFTGQSRQIGFVRYYNVEDARKAKEHMNNYKLDGHSLPLTVKYADNKEQKIARRALKPKPSLPLPPQPTELAPPHPLQLPFAYPVMPFYPPLFPYPPLLSHDMFAPTSSYSVPFFPFDPYQPQNWNEPMATPIDSSLQSDYFEGLPDGTLNIQSLYLDDNHQNGAHPLPYSNFPTLQNTLPDEP